MVVEEAVQSGEPSGEVRWLHTPVAAEIVNQVMLVPRSFFAEERDALDGAARLWDDLLRRFSEVADVGPEDPIARATLEADTLLSRSRSTASLAGAQHIRLDALREHRSDLWEAAAAGGGD